MSKKKLTRDYAILKAILYKTILFKSKFFCTFYFLLNTTIWAKNLKFLSNKDKYYDLTKKASKPLKIGRPIN